MAARQVQVILPFYDSKDKARTKYIIHTVRGLPFVYGLSVFDGKREKLVVFRVTPKATANVSTPFKLWVWGKNLGMWTSWRSTSRCLASTCARNPP
jgi:hypothetical protein